MRLYHNTMSLSVYQNYSKTLDKQKVALNNISTGLKINKAKDDPNGLAKAERMSLQIRGLQMAGRNSQDSVSMLQTADSAIGSTREYIQRIRDLTIQSGGALTPEDRSVIQKEINSMIKGVDDIAKNTEFNGVKMLGSDPTKSLKTVIGAEKGETLDIPLYDLSSKSIGNGTASLSTVDVTNKSVDENLSIIDGALSTILTAGSKYGALSNRLEGALTITGDMSETIGKAESSIRDADIAEEMMNFSKTSILKDAGIAMMEQCNKIPQEVLSILQRVK